MLTLQGRGRRTISTMFPHKPTGLTHYRRRAWNLLSPLRSAIHAFYGGGWTYLLFAKVIFKLLSGSFSHSAADACTQGPLSSMSFQILSD